MNDATTARPSRLASLGERAFMFLVLCLLAAIPLGYHYSDQPRPDTDTSFRAAVERSDLARIERASWDVLNATDEAGDTPLMVAAHLGLAPAVDVLLSRGVDPNVGHPDLGTPLMLAADRGHADIIRALLRHGANPNQLAGHGHDALYCAVLSGDTDSITTLLHAGAKLKVPTRSYSLLIAAAASGDRADLVRLLVAAGVDPDAAGTDGIPPLVSLARDADTHDCIRALLELGADPAATDPEGRTARDIATFGRDTRLLALLDEFSQATASLNRPALP